MGSYETLTEISEPKMFKISLMTIVILMTAGKTTISEVYNASSAILAENLGIFRNESDLFFTLFVDLCMYMGNQSL